MKKIAVMLLAVFLLCVPCMTAFAKEPEQKGATITTTVPAACNITFINNSGKIEENGKNLHGMETFERRSVHTFHIIPDKGKEIAKVLFGSEDVTPQVKDGNFTTPPLTADTMFEVLYKDAATSVEPVSEPISEPTKPDTSKPVQSGTTSTITSQNIGSTDTAKTGDTTTAIVFVIATVTAVSAAFIIVLAKSKRK